MGRAYNSLSRPGYKTATFPRTGRLLFTSLRQRAKPDTKFAPAFSPAMAALASFTRLAAPRPQRHNPLVTHRRDELLASGAASLSQLSTLFRERSPGQRPTIVLGGFVPDSTEQAFLLRRFLLGQGPVYYFNYSRNGFSVDLLCAQLEDLVEELALHGGRPPVILSVSFGGGIALEWLRRRRSAGGSDAAGLLFVSPVACTRDILESPDSKPTTLLGRALKPYLGSEVESGTIEKSRGLFNKMFEAGAQNRSALAVLMTPGQLALLRKRVRDTIGEIDPAGACERVRALRQMPPPSAFSLPLSHAPALVLYAEKEDAVICRGSPTRDLLEGDIRSVFPKGECRIVTGKDSPVQHASLIFHYPQFRPFVAAFFRSLKPRKIRLAE
jgi:pimeloyl-ACP methyl ester carboxylesterase